MMAISEKAKLENGESTQALDTRWEVILWRGRLEARLRDVWDYMVSVDKQAPIYNFRQWFQFACAANAIKPWGIVLVYLGDKPIGLFPLSKPSRWTFEIISFFTQGNPQLLIDDENSEQAWKGFVDWYAQQPGGCLLSLGVNSDEQHIAQFEQACSERNIILRKRLCRLQIVWSRLSSSWEQFVAERSSSTRKKLRNAENRLVEDFPDLQIDILSDPDSSMRALDEMITLYRQRWGRQVGGCSFDNPRNITFYRNAFRWAVEQGYGKISRVAVSSHPVALSSILTRPGQRTLYEQIIGRDNNFLPGRYSPGIYDLIHTFRWAMQQGIEKVNLGAGASQYKKMLAGEEHPLFELTAAHSLRDLKTLPILNRLVYMTGRLPIHVMYYLNSLSRQHHDK